jgi:hypothetical protein
MHQFQRTTRQRGCDRACNFYRQCWGKFELRESCRMRIAQILRLATRTGKTEQ